MTKRMLLCVLAFCACKKQETVQSSTTSASDPSVAATAPSVSVTAETIAIAPSASASAAPSASAALGPIDKEAAKQAALREAAEFGMIGIVPGDGGSAPWGREDTIGNAFGAGGLGARDGGALVQTPSLRQGAVTVNGRLPPEVIQRIVRQNFGRFKLCYLDGLRRNPHLQGRVTTKYIIDRDGSVKTTQDSGSDIGDQAVVNCVARAFGNLSYPQPEGGIVTVVFPLIFSPSP